MYLQKYTLEQFLIKLFQCFSIILGLELLKSSLSTLDIVQNHKHGFMGKIYSPLGSLFPTNTMLLFCSYFNGKYSDELHSLVLPVQTFQVCHATSMELNHFHFLFVPNIRKFHIASLLKKYYFVEQMHTKMLL